MVHQAPSKTARGGHSCALTDLDPVHCLRLLEGVTHALLQAAPVFQGWPFGD